MSSFLPVRAQTPAAGRTRRRRVQRSAAAFSFVEVLFAVMILGVGFIMLAAMFPVAIQQAQTNSDETVSAAIAWNALATIQEKLTDAELLPAVPPGAGATVNKFPAVVRSFRDPQAIGVPALNEGMNRWTRRDLPPEILRQPADYLWNRIRGESVVVDDRRYAWVAFYQRHIKFSDPIVPYPYAQVMVVVVRTRERSQYGVPDLGTEKDLANLQPRPVSFTLTSDGTGPSVDQVVRFTGGAASVAEGSYLVVAVDRLPRGPDLSNPQGFLNSHVFRIGNRLTDSAWELSPETEFQKATIGDTTISGLTNASGYVIGRTRTGTTTEGQAQDVAVYTMMIAVR